MKLSLSIVLLLISYSVFPQTKYVDIVDLESAAIKISRTSENILIKAKSCDDLNKEIEAIKKWTIRIGEKPGKTKCECSLEICSANVTDIVPKIVKEKQSTCAKWRGPNCWNGALVASKLISHLRFSSAEEMKFWMDSPLCVERKPDEARQPGDIIAIRNKYNEVHGFIHLSDQLSFSKNGAHSESPYSLQSPENVYDTYDVDKQCRNIYKTPANPDCHIWANTFSCISFDDYLAKNRIMNSEQKKTWDSLEKFDCDVSGLAFSSSFNKQLRDLTKISLKAIEALAEKKMRSAKTKRDAFVWKGILVKAKANLDAIGLNEYDNSLH